MQSSVLRIVTETPPTNCGDVFLSSFEWSPPSPRKNVFASTNFLKGCFEELNQSRKVDLPSAVKSAQNLQEEASLCAKRPSSNISPDSSSSLLHGFNRNEVVREKKRPCVIGSNSLHDVIQCISEDQDIKLIVTSASFPYHIEWVSSGWSKMCGWSCDEVLGLDCKFLQGDATDTEEVGRFMSQLMASGGHASLDIKNYFKDDTLHRVLLNCIPIMDECGPNNSKRVTHIGAVVVECQEDHHSLEFAELMEAKALSEVGMPLDRREGCHTCTNVNRLLPINAIDWVLLTNGLPLAHMMRYMIRSRAPIVLTDREGHIVHVNVGWVSMTGHSAVDCEGLLLSSLLDGGTGSESEGLRMHEQIMESIISGDTSCPAKGTNLVNLRRNPPSRTKFHSPVSRSAFRSAFSSSAGSTSTSTSATTPTSTSNSTSTSSTSSSSSSVCASTDCFPLLLASSSTSDSFDGAPYFNGGKALPSLILPSSSFSSTLPVPTPAPLLTPVELTPVPIGRRHIAVLCIPRPT